MAKKKQMPEADYILATNLTKVRFAINAAGGILPSKECPTEERQKILELLNKMLERCEGEIDSRDG